MLASGRVHIPGVPMELTPRSTDPPARKNEDHELWWLCPCPCAGGAALGVRGLDWGEPSLGDPPSLGEPLRCARRGEDEIALGMTGEDAAVGAKGRTGDGAYGKAAVDTPRGALAEGAEPNSLASAAQVDASVGEDVARESGLGEFRRSGEPERGDARGEARLHAPSASDDEDAFGLGDGVRRGEGSGNRSSSFSSMMGGGTGVADGAGRRMSSLRLMTPGADDAVASRREMDGPRSELLPSPELLLPD